MADAISQLMLVLGAVLVLLAGVGVLRFPDLYARMHAATKASTLGIALVGSAALVAVDGGRGKVVVAIAFIFVTAPSAAHFIGRVAYRAEGVETDLQARDDLRAMIEDIEHRPEADPPRPGDAGA